MKILLTSDTHRGFSKKTHIIHRAWAETLADTDFDVMVLAGDLASHKKDQFKGALKFFRAIAGTRPIVLVRGNHDFWDRQQISLENLCALHAELFVEFNIHYLEDGPFEKNRVAFVGWDGWYASLPANSNDSRWLPPPKEFFQTANGYLQNKERFALGRVIDDLDRLKARDVPPLSIVAVTHFPCVPHLGGEAYNANPRHFQLLQGRVDVLCMGHSHREVQGLHVGGVTLYNSGSDYDQPKAKVFEVLSGQNVNFR